MKLTTQTSVATEASIEVEEKFSLQGGKPCIDFVVSGYLVARQVIEQQSVGQTFRLINKLYVPTKPVEYAGADAVDLSGIKPDVTAPKPFIGVAVPVLTGKKTAKTES